MILNLPRKYRDPFKDVINNTGNSFKNINELHEFYDKETAKRKHRRIKL